MSTLPIELINLIMMYMSSPTAKILNDSVKEINDEYYYYYPDDNFSFAQCYFN